LNKIVVAASILLAQLPCVALAQADAAKSVPTKEWPIEAFAELPLMEQPEMSPDGRRIAARVASNGELMLVIADIFDAKAFHGLRLGENDLNWWSWARKASSKECPFI
jgi:hypothetical protein